MSRLTVPNIESATGARAEVYAQIRKTVGNVPNTYAAIGAYGPAAFKAVLAADAVLAAGTLTKADRETVKLIISKVAECDYCVAAHSSSPNSQGKIRTWSSRSATRYRPEIRSATR
jgi:AhpD family alkylhydroperoxidase